MKCYMGSLASRVDGMSHGEGQSIRARRKGRGLKQKNEKSIAIKNVWMKYVRFMVQYEKTKFYEPDIEELHDKGIENVLNKTLDKHPMEKMLPIV